MMTSISKDTRDIRSGAYDPINKDGLPQGHQVKDATTPRQREQWGADVRAEPLPGTEPVLPEGLLRERRDPLNRRTGRRATD
ncbi:MULTISPECIES: hypothetical protein [unclassified Bradyrhizobium]|uniref:hypothetical protein n=1 Tax=unclassified Bradyrhizobium TaxID=2631580 RepID=UPI0028EC3E4D|nr:MULTISPECIES: hypothetical protein [unclassified Bradyrhizobium]